MPLTPIPNTAAGWPYLVDNHAIPDVPEYSRLLAAKLAGMTPAPGGTPGDTGWLDITKAASIAGAARVRVIGTVAYLRGALSGTIASNTNTQIGTVPAGCRPVEQTVRSCREVVTATDAGIWIDTAGAIWVRKAAATGTASFDVSTLSGYTTT